MSYSIDANGHLDLSPCYQGLRCDYLKASEISHEFFFAEMQGLVAWDGTRITGTNHEGTWVKLVAKHNAPRKPFNPLVNLDLNRVVRLPVLKETLLGHMPTDVFSQQREKAAPDTLQLVVSGIDKDYVVVLGRVKGSYVLRSAYPGDQKYSEKVRARSTLIERIRP